MNKYAEIDAGRLAVGIGSGIITGTGAYLLGRLLHGKKKRGLPWLYAMLGGAGGLAGGYAMSKNWFKPISAQKEKLKAETESLEEKKRNEWVRSRHELADKLTAEKGIRFKFRNEYPNEPERWLAVDENGNIITKDSKGANALLEWFTALIDPRTTKASDVGWGLATSGAVAGYKAVNIRRLWEDYNDRVAERQIRRANAKQDVVDKHQRIVDEADRIAGERNIEPGSASYTDIVKTVEQNEGWTATDEARFKRELPLPTKTDFALRQVKAPFFWGLGGHLAAKGVRLANERIRGASAWQEAQKWYDSNQ